MKVLVKSNLDDFLKESGIRKNWLAEKIGADNSYITKWCKNDERGVATSTPSVGYLLRITKVLRCNVEDLFVEVKNDELNNL